MTQFTPRLILVGDDVLLQVAYFVPLLEGCQNCQHRSAQSHFASLAVCSKLCDIS